MWVCASCALQKAPSTGGQYSEGKWVCRQSGVKVEPVASKQFKTGRRGVLLYVSGSAQKHLSERVSFISISALHWSSSPLCATNYLLPW